MSLIGKAAVVTGSTSEIGLAIARDFAKGGANVVINGFGNPDAVEKTRAAIETEFGVKALYSPADLTKIDQLNAMIDLAVDAFGSIDVLVNNAGVQHVDPIENFPNDKWDLIIALNLSAAFHAMQAAIPHMKMAGWGRIISTASAHSLVGSPFKSAYVAAKHGIAGLTKAAALELATHKITVNCISPGYAIRLFQACALSLAIAGCSTLPRTSYTSADADMTRVLNLADLRRYSDEPASKFRRTDVVIKGKRTYLALSGGGADGAYGAGVLNGWTETGNRPLFTMVSGVSTGALIAPFAFLGSEYDATLRDVYTSGVAQSLLEAPNLLNAIFGSGLFGNQRLRELVAQYINSDFVAKVGAEYAKGRMLFIVTTNLDSQRTAIWDMGRIASLGTPAAVSLFQDVVAASASIPVIFPPMMVAIEANGRRLEEMHVDGGVTTPVLTVPEAFLLRDAKLGPAGDLDIYILVNNKVNSEFQVVPNTTLEIASRSSSTMTKLQTRSILFNTYDFARRNRYGYYLTYIQDDQPRAPTAGFDTAYMRKLFEYGYERGRGKDLWSLSPPSDVADPSQAPDVMRKLAGSR